MSICLCVCFYFESVGRKYVIYPCWNIKLSETQINRRDESFLKSSTCLIWNSSDTISRHSQTSLHLHVFTKDFRRQEVQQQTTQTKIINNCVLSLDLSVSVRLPSLCTRVSYRILVFDTFSHFLPVTNTFLVSLKSQSDLDNRSTEGTFLGGQKGKIHTMSSVFLQFNEILCEKLVRKSWWIFPTIQYWL